MPIEGYPGEEYLDFNPDYRSQRPHLLHDGKVEERALVSGAHDERRVRISVDDLLNNGYKKCDVPRGLGGKRAVLVSLPGMGTMRFVEDKRGQTYGFMVAVIDKVDRAMFMEKLAESLPENPEGLTRETRVKLDRFLSEEEA